MSKKMKAAREHWTSKIGFLFAAIGSAVGLGVLWKFPYTVGENGGGLFFLTYIICTVFIGIPMFAGELLLGRRSQKSAVSSFGVLSNKAVWKLGGWFGVFASFLIMAFYSVIAGWGMSYIVMSLCRLSNTLTLVEVESAFTSLKTSGEISVLWHLLFTAITTAIVFSGVRKGIEYWSRIITRVLVIILICLVIYNMFLPGFYKTFTYLFHFNIQSFNYASLIEALGLSLFTLSLGQGIMISYGSYLNEDDNLLSMATIVAISVIIIATLAAFVVFPTVFSFGMEPSSGTGLIFQTMPFLFANLPGSLLISTVFFILFVFTALTSSMAFIEVCTSNGMELFGWNRKKAVLLSAIGTAILGVPCAYAFSNGIFPDWELIYGTNFFETINRLVSTWLIPVGALFISCFLGWGMKKSDTFDELRKGGTSPFFITCWYYAVRYFIPLFIILVILEKSEIFST